MSTVSSTLEAGKLNNYVSTFIVAKWTHLTWRNFFFSNQLTFKSSWRILSNLTWVKCPHLGQLLLSFNRSAWVRCNVVSGPSNRKTLISLNKFKNESLKYFPWHPTATEPTLVVAYIWSSCHGRQISPEIHLNQISCTESWEEMSPGFTGCYSASLIEITSLKNKKRAPREKQTNDGKKKRKKETWQLWSSGFRMILHSMSHSSNHFPSHCLISNNNSMR